MNFFELLLGRSIPLPRLRSSLLLKRQRSMTSAADSLATVQGLGGISERFNYRSYPIVESLGIAHHIQT